MNSSRNLKAEIKHELTNAVDRLYQLVKEAEMERTKMEKERTQNSKEIIEEPQAVKDVSSITVPLSQGTNRDEELLKKLEVHTKFLEENSECVKKLQATLELQQEKEKQNQITYANITAGYKQKQQTALHSIAVTSKDETETGEQVLEKIKKAVRAKEGGITVDKIRKAKNQKVIMGCRTEEDRKRVTERLRESGEHLHVEEIKNKDPLIILWDVMSYNSNEEIISALKSQNKGLFEKLSVDDQRMEIRYRKRTRNPHMCHLIIRVSPTVWRNITSVGVANVDLQRVRVEDHSPLIQCTVCLGYGHGRRHCKEEIEKCSHCGGAHMKAKCEEWLAEMPPTCINCSKSKHEKVGHNAFSQECPVRKRWDALARASIAYC